jgi:hypothetical protein
VDVLPSTPELLRGDQGGQARLERVQLARPRRARVDAPRTAASALTSTADLVSALAALLTAGSGSLQIWLSQRHLLGPAVGSPNLLRAPVPARCSRRGLPNWAGSVRGSAIHFHGAWSAAYALNGNEEMTATSPGRRADTGTPGRPIWVEGWRARCVHRLAKVALFDPRSLPWLSSSSLGQRRPSATLVSNRNIRAQNT